MMDYVQSKLITEKITESISESEVIFVRRVERIQVRKNKRIEELCKWSRTIWNRTLWYFFRDLDTDNWLSYYDLVDLVRYKKEYREMPEERRKAMKNKEKQTYIYDYWKVLPTSAANIVKKVCDSLKSWWKGLKEFHRNPRKFNGCPKPPKFKKKDEMAYLGMTYIQFKAKNNTIIFQEKIGIEPVRYIYATHFEESVSETTKKYFHKSRNVKEVRIIPRNNIFNIEIVFEKQIDPLDLDPNRIVGIDLGVNNLVVCVNNFGKQPFGIRGNAIKSINHRYNKEIGKYQSLQHESHKKVINPIMEKKNKKIATDEDYEKLREFTRQTKKRDYITLGRNNKILKMFHDVSKYIIDYCIENNVGKIAIGYNPKWKQNLKKNPDERKTSRRKEREFNQKFTEIPFNTLVSQIEYKGEEAGVEVKRINEAYTSICSFLDNEEVKKHDKYLGKRERRGLFITSKGIKINADVNGAYNILRIAFPEAEFKSGDGITGLIHPVFVPIFSDRHKSLHRGGGDQIDVDLP